MDSVGDVVVRVLFGVDLDQATGPCSRCMASFFVDSLSGNSAGEVLCRGCGEGDIDSDRVRAEAVEIIGRLAEITPGWLERAGMSGEEALRPSFAPRIFPVLGRVCADQISEHSVADLCSGSVARYGFGVGGTAGVGKTYALAAIFKAAAFEWIRSHAARYGWAAIRPRPWLSWIHWPAAAREMRVTTMRDGGHEVVEALIERWCSAPAVVLDDVGAERIAAGVSYDQDFATSQLDLLVGAREREGLPTWYTTNLGEEALFDKYGARMFSRLVRRNPLVDFGSGRDLRKPGAVTS